MWIKPNGEMPFLYGNHVLKAHLGRITEDTPEHQGVVVYSMSDVPLVKWLGFHTICRFQYSFLTGIRSYVEINNRHTKIGPDSYCRVPPGVSDLQIFCCSLCSGFLSLQGCRRVPPWWGETIVSQVIFVNSYFSFVRIRYFDHRMWAVYCSTKWCSGSSPHLLVFAW